MSARAGVSGAGTDLLVEAGAVLATSLDLPTTMSQVARLTVPRLADLCVIDLQAQDGLSVMEAAVASNVPGIDADCGGACACATCHVYIDEGWADRLPAKTELEIKMLEFAAMVEPTSRLSCRLVVGPDTDGLVMRIPASQH